MTVIVALEKNGKIYMGSDRMATFGNETIIMSNPKIREKGEFLFGSAGSLSTLQVLFDAFSMPPIKEKQTQIEYLLNDFAPAFRKRLKELGMLEEKNGLQHSMNHFIIGFRGKLFSCGSSLAMVEHADGYCSIGSGSEFALGVLHVLKDDKKLKPEEIIQKALEAAAHHNPYVAEPFDIISGAEKEE
jgi:ATP-dependent protease HslVU (ClpYQ) peptidase subunit